MTIAVTPRSPAMSFEKAQQLLELATFVAARRVGVTLDDVVERFGISRRTAQRIMHALEAQFPDTESGGTIAARLLIELGIEPTKAIENVKAARPGAIETRDQERFVKAIGTARK
jgi:predicted DNA-binding transcriptional regulator YafY